MRWASVFTYHRAIWGSTDRPIHPLSRISRDGRPLTHSHTHPGRARRGADGPEVGFARGSGQRAQEKDGKGTGPRHHAGGRLARVFPARGACWEMVGHERLLLAPSRQPQDWRSKMARRPAMGIRRRSSIHNENEKRKGGHDDDDAVRVSTSFPLPHRVITAVTRLAHATVQMSAKVISHACLETIDWPCHGKRAAKGESSLFQRLVVSKRRR